MTHSIGQVIHDGVVIGYVEYDHTADQAYPIIRASEADVDAHWRQYDEAPCHCAEETLTDVFMFVEDCHWPAKACLECATLRDGQFKPELPKPGHPIGSPDDEKL